MPSFLQGMKSVGKAMFNLASSPTGQVIVSLFNPALGAIWTRTTQCIVRQEAHYEDQGLQGQGPLKHNGVVGDFNDSLAVTQEILRSQSKLLVYSADALDDAIRAQVGAMNAYKRLQSSFKIEDQ